MQGSEKAHNSATIDRAEGPSKKARNSPPPPASQSTAKASLKENMPAKTTLPPLLSPTLPPEIEEELAKAFIPQSRTIVHKKGDSMTSVSTKMSSSSRLSSPVNSQDLKSSKELVKPDSKPRQVNKTAPTSQPAKLAEPQNHRSELKQIEGPKKSLESASPMTGSSGAKPRLPHTPNSARKEPATTLLDEEERPSKIVVIKIPKRLRQDMSRLLKMNQLTKKQEPVTKEKPVQAPQPRPKTQERAQKEKLNGTTQSRDDIVPDSKKLANKATKPAEKRSRDDDPDADKAPVKRQKPLKAIELAQKPRTPIPQPFRSPPLPPSANSQKTQISTPLREVKTVASRNVDSVDADVKTPQGLARTGTPLAPNSVGSASREGRASSNTSSRSGKSDDINTWRAEHKRYIEMGRTLKHDADDLFKLKAKKDQDELQLEKRGIATALETVLCYILAYTASDETQRLLRKSREIQAWKSLLPYLHYVRTVTIGHSLLHGLCLQLEAICRNNIQILDFERLEREAVPTGTPEETKVLTPDPNADPSQVDAATKATQTRNNYIEFKNKMVENARAAQLTWAEGSSELSVDDLQQSFPISWKKKSRVPLAKTKEKLVAGSLGGDFYLPLSNISLGIEAARAGWSLLGEWCKQNEVKWEGRLGL